MSSNVVNSVSYLRTSRNFPEDIKQLVVEINKSYVDVANAVNSRTIGLFSIGKPAITGETWFLNNRQQSLRQVYDFTSTASIAHGINITPQTKISPKSYGVFTDGTNWYGLIFASSVAIAGQRSFYVTPTNIVFVTGVGAPTLTSGIIVLEWITNP